MLGGRIGLLRLLVVRLLGRLRKGLWLRLVRDLRLGKVIIRRNKGWLV